MMDHPMQENTTVAGIVANAKLMRTDYGVGVGDWAATAVVGDEVDITLNLELTTSAI
jgi:polyisoprenoid-binding protein YceI